MNQPKTPFVIGTPDWPGVAKAIEECGELTQALGKLIAYPDGPHPDGGNTYEYVMDEAADVLAAVQFLIEENLALDYERILNRVEVKLARFRGWHQSDD